MKQRVSLIIGKSAPGASDYEIGVENLEEKWQLLHHKVLQMSRLKNVASA